MSRLNVPSTIVDPAYRYTMPKMALRQESRLNGVKTNISNLDDLANALRVPDLVVMKYFCAELGASHVTGSIMTGSHDYASLLKGLDKFIHNYVLCKKCNYPELVYKAEKKDLFGKCNSCSTIRKLDAQHKAGKQLLKEVPTFNPSGVDIVTNDNSSLADAIKKTKKEGGMLEEEKKESKSGPKGSKKGKKEIEEIPVKELTITSEEIDSAIKQLDLWVSEEERTIDDVLLEVKTTQCSLSATPDFKYYLLFSCLFTGKRNCVQHWVQYESAFLRLVQLDAELGPIRLLQTICVYFAIREPSMQKYISTFFRMLYDQSVFSDELVIGWQKNDIKSDKKCCMYDRKAEKTFRPLLEPYVKWLESEEAAEYDEEEEEVEEVKKQVAPVKKEETEEDKQQRELIEQQQKRMQEQMEAQKVKAEETMALEAQMKAERAAQLDVEDVTKIEVGDDDDFDIDDI